MKLIPFDQVRQQLLPGVPLPWNVRNAAGDLLLAKGQVVPDAAMLAGLKERGAFADADEIAALSNRQDLALTIQMSGRWATLEARLHTILRSPTQQHFLRRVREVLVHVAAAAHANADEVIYLIMRHDHSRLEHYGIAHSLHCAALCGLLARRLGWANSTMTSLMGAALTMNISVLELQGTLARRGGAMTWPERMAIEDHPGASARILREAGLRDEIWLEAVEQHHEAPGGHGYPGRLAKPSEMSQLLRLVDMFTAKHSPRTGRLPVPAMKAAQDMFRQAKGDPLVSLLIKELGIYPPGCCVRLASGEVGVVVRVGSTAASPTVSVLQAADGSHLPRPVLRKTDQADYRIVESLPDTDLALPVHDVPLARLSAGRELPAAASA